ncbi:hypothetical protein TRFO_23380 [Tritrichomonas foetus]|uniref:Uncharacterized protein n=1 Tax=Tritrichomonas foetus TaxID=1144522 RepID=A0A1J4KF07_9EUKA|nr:hypothetical protein TRFO_23380 [Tritrichomonas foetus]|eukprot:OHT08174.1 hypothetical protein TRFO_23380 [Tritrichomonas foetus]
MSLGISELLVIENENLNDGKNKPKKMIKMWIDIMTPSEILFTLFIFSIILSAILLSGLNHRNKAVFSEVPHKFNNNMQGTRTEFVLYEFPHISSYNRYVTLGIYFYRRTDNPNVTNTNISKHILFSLDVYKTGDKGVYNSTKVPIDILCEMNETQNVSGNFIIYKDYFIRYKSLDIGIDMRSPDNATFNQYTVYSYLGGTDFSKFSLYYRILLSVILSGMLIIFIFTNCFKKYKNTNTTALAASTKSFSNTLSHNSSILQQVHILTVEQIIVLPLIVMLIINNYPLYYNHLQNPTENFYINSVTFDSILNGYSCFTILVLFYQLDKSNSYYHSNLDEHDQKSKWSFVKEILAYTFYTGICIEITYTSYNHKAMKTTSMINIIPLTYKEFDINEITQKQYVYSQIVVSIFIIILMMKSLIICFVSQGDYHKLIIYYYATFILLFQMLMINSLSQIFDVLNNWLNPDDQWVMLFTLENIFAGLLLYVHWPIDERTVNIHINNYEGAKELNIQDGLMIEENRSIFEADDLIVE